MLEIVLGLAGAAKVTPCLCNPATLNIGCEARWGVEAAGREAAALWDSVLSPICLVYRSKGF